MILKTAANYNDEGGYIEAWKNSDGTTEVKLIPKNGGGDEGKNGIKSISISPEITTTPALDTVFPIYYDDLNEDEQQQGITRFVTAAPDESNTYTVTVTPTPDWYAQGENGWGAKGEPVTVTGFYEDGYLYVDTIVAAEPYDGAPTGEFIMGSLILSPAVIESVSVTPNIEGLSDKIAKYLPLHITENRMVYIDDLQPAANTDYSITVTPNENAYAFDYAGNEYGAQGQPVTYTVQSSARSFVFEVSGAPTVDGPASSMHVEVSIN